MRFVNNHGRKVLFEKFDISIEKKYITLEVRKLATNVMLNDLNSIASEQFSNDLTGRIRRFQFEIDELIQEIKN